MTEGMDAEQTIIEVGRELTRFKAASQQLEVTGENLEGLQNRLGKLAESSNALLAEVRASLERYIENIEKQSAAVLADIRGLDLAEFKGRMEADVDSLQQAVGNVANTTTSQHEDLRSHVDSRFGSLEMRLWLLLAVATAGFLFAALSVVLVVVTS